MDIDTVTKAWLERVYNESYAADVFSDEDWHSMACGFALGMGLSIDEAAEFALHCER